MTAPPTTITDALIGHATRERFESLPAPAIDAARTFILDSLGVALSGTRCRWCGT